jgi:hypothetical protein
MHDRRIAAVVLYMGNLRGACARSFEAGNHFQMAISLLQSIPQATKPKRLATKTKK